MLKKVLKNSLLYSMSSLILRASSIILFPIFSFYLTKQDYGTLSITQSIIAIIATFSALEIPRSITRHIYDKSLENVDKKEILSTGVIITIVSSIIWIVAIITIGKILLEPVLNGIPFYPYMFFTAASLLFTSVVGVYQNYLKSIQKGKKSFLFEIQYYGCNILLNLFFVVIMKMDIIGLIYSTIISGVLFSALFYFQEFRNFKIVYNKKVSKALLSYSIPLIPFAIFGFLIENTDKFILHSVDGVEISGLYYIVLTFGSIFSTVKESLIAAITPWFFENYSENSYEQIKKVFTVILAGGGLLCILISIFSYEALYILSNNPDFVLAWKYIPLITFGFFIVFIGQIFNLPIYYSKKTNYFFVTNLSGFIICALFAYLLIPKYGIYGAILSKLFGYITMAIIQFFFARTLSKFRFDVLKIIIIIFFAGILVNLHFIDIKYIWKLSIKIMISIALLFAFLAYTKQSFFRGMDIFSIIKRIKS